jgi:hypothetical protein
MFRFLMLQIYYDFFIGAFEGASFEQMGARKASGYGLTTGRSRFNPRQRRKDFSSNLCVQTGSGDHPASCTMGTGDPFPGAKARQGCEAHHSPLSSAEVENE